jgi:hypothetical protein
MWRLSREYQSGCAEFQEALEQVSSVEQSEGVVAVESVAQDDVALGAFLSRLPEHARQHARACGDCRTAAAELLQVRAMFQSADTGAQPGPYFLARVMAAIADREVELEKSSQTWAAVPRLAYRLSVLASITLLVAGSWLYQQPRRATVAGVSATQNSEGLVEGTSGTAQDDFLLNSVER